MNKKMTFAALAAVVGAGILGFALGRATKRDAVVDAISDMAEAMRGQS